MQIVVPRRDHFFLLSTFKPQYLLQITIFSFNSFIYLFKYKLFILYLLFNLFLSETDGVIIKNLLNKKKIFFII